LSGLHRFSGSTCALQDLAYGFDATGNLSMRERATSTAPTIRKLPRLVDTR